VQSVNYVSEIRSRFHQSSTARGKSELADTQSLVVSNAPVNSQYFQLVVRADAPATSARAGQFFNIACPRTRSDFPYLRRPMSVFKASPVQREVEFLYKVTGAGTRALSSLRPGDTLAILGPLGNGFTLSQNWRNIVVVGRGVGLATLAPLAEMAAERAIGVIAVLSARSRELVMTVERFRAVGAKVEIVTDEAGTSDPEHVEHILLAAIERNEADAFFTCGSDRLMQLLKRLAGLHNIPGQVAMEQQMACGLGMCFSCVRTFQSPHGFEQRRVCLEGPVFKMSEALSW
jgi:dihydroorotate dehydrogenase electron transfer subunit